ncbi:ABC transporter ATP-binding protein [Arthrobacter cupressi]|uniref:Amino acid/amide ABC transporter ATP-binding protein 1, HAAT family n=1 Tax=Arthrobacter cupressi TaxID=1045773 RepID=A0A1G8IPR7_9MICC|nr:ABC transporter ATP-binding protein [Arthrobacter cupressi]NYD79087.1 branched-chain amino acid transport system ATP-binding protein [Arthrobacter cupressi]SDI20949.1 amino acid/amide ABC transporter ATP-binding protein 1, HAAT family [Arthrobacter cupressi]
MSGTNGQNPDNIDYMTDTRAIAVGENLPGCKKRDPIVVADNVTRNFGGISAVDVEHLEIPRHKITALIGPNGAGKTTLFNLLTGFDTPNSGSWTFEGNNIAGVSSYKVARMGMVRTFQLTKVMGKLTVMENMRLGAANQPGERLSKALFKNIWGGREREITKHADVLLEKFKLDTKKDDYAASLSGGQRKLLEMARSLMVRPKLVMLDEPMAGVNPALTQSLLDHIKNLKAEGMTVLFVEHDMNMVRHIADWVVVMAEGRIVAEGPPAEVMKDPAVIDAYLGAHHDVDLGDAEGIRELEAELEADEESIVGTEDAGIIAPEAIEARLEEEEGK